jgi:type IV pilus assembly protein PilN
MRIDINLATQPYEDSQQLWVRWGSGVAVIGLFTLMLLYMVITGWISARKDRNLIRQREEQIAERDNEKTKAEVILSLPENRNTRDRSQFLNDLFQRKAFSWTKVFEDLERVMPARLHVVSIHPEMPNENQLQIKLRVAGESHERALELVRKMEGSQRFQQTRIDIENFQSGQTTGDNVEVDITAMYVPDFENLNKQRTQ